MIAARAARNRGKAIGRRLLARLPIRVHSKPDFLIIGAQKAGTSSLYAWITSHPDVVEARTKELHYFDRRSPGAPIADYWPNFPTRAKLTALRLWRGRPVMTGEATPIYLFDPRVPRMVSRHLPSVKLIAVLRDPVDRAVSHYWMERNGGHEDLGLDDALASEESRLKPELERVTRGEPPGPALRHWSYIARGRYAEQLERWLEYFPSSQILIIDFAELVASPCVVYRRVLGFLGVDPEAAPTPSFAAQRVGQKQETAPATVARLRCVFAEPNLLLKQVADLEFNPPP